MTIHHSTFTNSAPRLDTSAGAARLLVDGEPFWVRGVELHNSTASSRASLAHGLDTARAVHANTVLASISWDLIEPIEGEFDLSSVERIITQAREADLRLVLLWFGAWKNGMSSYAPSWVKRDWARFPRCVLDDGRLTGTLTPFGPTDLDRAAFEAVMGFLEDFDREARTVLMVQIENEIGLLGASRDHSRHAQSVFDAPVPSDLHDALAQREGFSHVVSGLSWADVDSDPLGRDEAFMAWGYASHVQKLASAGRLISDIPFFVNAWLDSDLDLEIPGFTVAGGQTPGMYPSGGPLPRVRDVWTTVATEIDLFAPDVYFGDLNEIYTSFVAMSGGLFIPEQRVGADGVGAAFLAWGEYAAIGVSPFGVDSRTPEELRALTDGYRILRDVSPLLMRDSGGRRHTRGFHLTDEKDSVRVVLGERIASVTRASAFGVEPSGTHGYGILIEREDGALIIAGRGFRVAFDHVDPAMQVCLDSVVELASSGSAIRILNGDETGSGTLVVHPPLDRVEGVFPIPAGHVHSGVSLVHTFAMPAHDPLS